MTAVFHTDSSTSTHLFVSPLAQDCKEGGGHTVGDAGCSPPRGEGSAGRRPPDEEQGDEPSEMLITLFPCALLLMREQILVCRPMCLFKCIGFKSSCHLGVNYSGDSQGMGSSPSGIFRAIKEQPFAGVYYMTVGQRKSNIIIPLKVTEETWPHLNYTYFASASMCGLSQQMSWSLSQLFTQGNSLARRP